MKTRIGGFILAGSGLMMNVMTAQASLTVGNLRVQALGEHLVRIEQRGPLGFEDRETFTVRERTFEPVEMTESRSPTATTLATARYRVVIPHQTTGVDGVRVDSASGELLGVLSNAAVRIKTFLPSPSALPSIWVMGDHPRVIPSPRGALPPPEGEDDPSSGWELGNDAQDVYVFFPSVSGYEAFRSDFLRLTGAVPMVPLYTLGVWYSRYYPYDEEGALDVIERFRRAHIPLDVFVLDTDWRKGASSGYEINETLFPDLERFIRRAHEERVRIMLNDHPEPRGKGALDPEELRFRQQGLVSLLDLGVDLWWFDRNWHTHLQAPAPGLEKEVWGMRLYHDITQEAHPQRRPLILSNVDGINNGRLDTPSHPAAHRFPVWWTGDTVAEWHYLGLGVRNGVDCGILSLLPYVHEDLGGHHGQPDAELYVRYMQFGAFSPVTRIHCSTKVHRYPWAYGEAVEQIAGDFFRLRYRLLPMLYAAAYEAHRSGVPLMRRCDLEWPGIPEAIDSTQYLLGSDLLVAPILSPACEGTLAERTVWIPPGEWQDAWTGQIHSGPATIGVTCALERMPIYIRRGGVLFTIPQRQSTGLAIWPELVVDAFVPRQDQSTTRCLYEDDGHSVAYQGGAMARTEVQLRQHDSESRLLLKPQPAPEGIRPELRKLTLRVHLPPDRRIQSVQFQGRILAADEFTLLSPSEGRSSRLFEGGGALPPSEAGSIMEWRGSVKTSETQEWVVVTQDACE